MKSISFTQTIMQKAQKGFTLIELLIVIGILAILMAIVLVALNPARQFAQTNNTTRRNDVTEILNSIGQYMADNAGKLPPGILADGNTHEIANTMNDGAGGTGVTFCTTITPKYLAALPTDPSLSTNGANVSNCTNFDTGLTVSVSTGSANRVTISAPDAQAIDGVVPNISVTR